MRAVASERIFKATRPQAELASGAKSFRQMNCRWSKYLLVSVTAAWAPAKAQAGAKCEGKAGIADGRDVLVVEKIFSLRIDINPGEPLVACAEIELGVAEVEIAIRQDKRVVLIDVFVTEECGVVAAAGESCGEDSRDSLIGVGR